MIDNKSRKRLPPYVSYRTFRNFIDGLQEVTPARIDRSYWGDRLSGSTGTQLMAALRFLGLVDANGIPTARLKGLAAARGEHRNELLREMTTEAFGFLTLSSFDMQTATSAQLQEVFHYTFQLTGDVGRKCIKFFVALVSDAGMPLSPFITKRFRISHGNTGTKTATKRSTARTSRSAVVPQSMEEVPLRKSWDEMLITKFPTFDPTWSDEVKLKWFEAFDELLKRGLVKG